MEPLYLYKSLLLLKHLKGCNEILVVKKSTNSPVGKEQVLKTNLIIYHDEYDVKNRPKHVYNPCKLERA